MWLEINLTSLISIENQHPIKDQKLVLNEELNKDKNILSNNESISEWLIWLLLLKTKLSKFGIFFPLPGDQLVSFLLKPLTFLVFKNLKNRSLSNSILASSIENIGDNNVLS